MVFTSLRWNISQCILAVFDNFLIENPSPECSIPSTTQRGKDQLLEQQHQTVKYKNIPKLN